MRRVTAALVETVGADSALYHEFDVDGWGVIHATAPNDVWEALPVRGRRPPICGASTQASM